MCYRSLKIKTDKCIMKINKSRLKTLKLCDFLESAGILKVALCALLLSNMLKVENEKHDPCCI